MAENDITDGTSNFTGGQNASKSPDLVPDNAYYSGVNVTTENGMISPRWGYEEKILTFPETTFRLPTGFQKPYESVFGPGKFQALIPYSIGRSYFLIIVISGVIYLVNQKDFSVKIIEIADGSKLDEHAARIHWSNAGRFLVLFDFPAFPVIIESGLARRSDPTKMEVPISELGAYNQNRLLISNASNEFTASDPAGYAFPDGPITFTEIETPASPFYGQIFQLSTNYNNDPITAMAFLQTVDNSTGIGPALVSTQNAIYSYQTQLPRDQWEAGQFGSIFIAETGIAGPRACTNVNSDFFFIDFEGYMRTASMSRDEQRKWSKVPMSLEVKNYLKADDQSLWEFANICYWKNKIFVTAHPYRTLALDTLLNPVMDYASGGFVVLELANVSSFTLGEGPPAWAGLWTGIRPMDMVVNNKRAFIMSKDDDNINRLYELRDDIRYDIIGKEKKIRKVKSKIYTKEYDFKSPYTNKQLKNIEFAPKNIKGEFNLSVKYKTSQQSEFIFWNSFSHEAPWRSCLSPIDCINGFAPHDFKEVNLGPPKEDSCSPITEDSDGTFRQLQLLLEMEGIYWEIKGFVIRGIVLPQNDTEVVCEPYKTVAICKECISDWKNEGNNICHATTRQL